MKTSILAAAALAVSVLAVALPVSAMDDRVERQLKALDPQERREQRCDMEAMARIAKEGNGYRPDKVIAYTRGETVEKGDDIKAPGAVFRSAGDWYQLRYRCQTGDHGLSIVSFDYKIGDKIPRSKWNQLYLYD